MAIDSIASFVDEVCRHRLVDSASETELRQRLVPRHQNPQTLAQEIMRRGWLTPYQVNQVFQGNAAQLDLGHYVVLERLGEGGMGQVFKALQRPLNRVVALKVLRQKYLANAEVVERFRREIQAAAQLNHPNIVLAYDAGELGGNHFYTMEFMEGSTLNKLVERSGPLPISLATEYVRQAAMGLQHAFEHGLVHRDIKPSNLILTWSSIPSEPNASAVTDEHNRKLWGSHLPLIKIFDMGLVTGPVLRLSHEDGTPLTQKGMLMGTPDFIAPEQALNARLADTRSDLYSLGATYYFLLSGSVPFPGGVPMEKIMRHQIEDARSLKLLRADVPVEVRKVVRKLMDKKPENRFQTPKDLADALRGLQKHLESLRSAKRSGESQPQ